MNGDLVANASHDIWSGTLLHAIDFTETGQALGTLVFTATLPAGLLDPTRQGLGEFGDQIVGNSSSSDSGWIDFARSFNLTAHSFYGYSDVITVAAPVPEPGTWLFILTGFGTLAAGSRKKTRRAQAGFTTPELMVATAIIGILTGVLVPAVQKVREAAVRVVGENDLSAICHGELSYRQSHPAYAGGLPLLSGLIPDKLLGGVADGWGFAITFAGQNAFSATATYLSPKSLFEPKLSTDQSCQIGETFFNPSPPPSGQDTILLSAATLVAQFLNADPALIPQVRSFVNSPATLSQVLTAIAPPPTATSGGITIPGILAWSQHQPAPVANFVQSLGQQLGWGANGEDFSQIPPVNPADIQWDQSRNLFSFDGLRRLTNLVVTEPLAFSLTAKLDAAEEAEKRGNGKAKNRLLDAYRHELSAVSGKFITEGDANTLSTLSLAFD